MYHDSKEHHDYKQGQRGIYVNSRAGQHGFYEHSKKKNASSNHQSNNPGCFTAESKVLTANGPVPIIDIKPSQTVLAYDQVNGRFVETVVTKNMFYGQRTIWHIECEGEVIKTTKYHPFLTEKHGWVKAKDLQPGVHKLVSFDSFNVIHRAVLKSSETSMMLDVYNLNTFPYQNFCVNHVIAHNYNFALTLRTMLANVLKRKDSLRDGFARA